jgi:hypothetical protein
LFESAIEVLPERTAVFVVIWDQLAPLLLGAKREGKVEGGKLRLCGKPEQFLAQEAQRNLGIGPFEDGAGEAQQGISAAIIAIEAAHRAQEVRRPLEETCAAALDLQHPTCLAQEPLPQRFGMTINGGETLMLGAKQRCHEQRPNALAELLLENLSLSVADCGAVSVMPPAHQATCVGVIVIR